MASEKYIPQERFSGKVYMIIIQLILEASNKNITGHMITSVLK